ADGTYFYKVTATFASGESLPSGETKVDVAGGSGNGRVSLTWGAVDGATGYKVYRSDATGTETLLKTITGGGTTSYNDTTTGWAGDGTPDGSTKPPTTDTNSGIAVGVAVTVAVVNTKAFIANALMNATSLTIDAKAPGTDKSSYVSSATSGAGGTGSGG